MGSGKGLPVGRGMSAWEETQFLCLRVYLVPVHSARSTWALPVLVLPSWGTVHKCSARQIRGIGQRVWSFRGYNPSIWHETEVGCADCDSCLRARASAAGLETFAEWSTTPSGLTSCTIRISGTTEWSVMQNPCISGGPLGESRSDYRIFRPIILNPGLVGARIHGRRFADDLSGARGYFDASNLPKVVSWGSNFLSERLST